MPPSVALLYLHEGRPFESEWRESRFRRFCHNTRSGSVWRECGEAHAIDEARHSAHVDQPVNVHFASDNGHGLAAPLADRLVRATLVVQRSGCSVVGVQRAVLDVVGCRNEDADEQRTGINGAMLWELPQYAVLQQQCAATTTRTTAGTLWHSWMNEAMPWKGTSAQPPKHNTR